MEPSGSEYFDIKVPCSRVANKKFLHHTPDALACACNDEYIEAISDGVPILPAEDLRCITKALEIRKGHA
jgi:hypothetical protein